MATELPIPVHAVSHDAHVDGGRPISPVLAVLAWLWVLVPFGYGLYQLLIKISALRCSGTERV